MAVRTRHYSRRTEEAYVAWAKRYILFHGKKHPSAMGAEEINAFLTHLAVEDGVAESTQNQALSALLFLYRKVLQEEVGWIADLVRATRPKRLPVVFTRETGHVGDHVRAQRPPKAIINGEPSYEHSGRRGVAEGWWQGQEAWSNLCAGALMGVAYGAASLWPWRLHPDEPGHGEYFLAEGAGWKEALDFEGSRYVGRWARSSTICRSPKPAPAGMCPPILAAYSIRACFTSAMPSMADPGWFF